MIQSFLLFTVFAVASGAIHGQILPGKCVHRDAVISQSAAKDPNVGPPSNEHQFFLWSSANDINIKGEIKSPPLEIEPLIVSGLSGNRVNLVFFSDGYLQEERPKFIKDALRLAQDVSGNQTFNTVKPLLNFWAAFTPSKESGVGVGGVPKDTPFGLYRDGTELRGVYYAHPEVAEAACSSMGEKCDYPILLGNDPLYGGLGGRFTVITSSLANGPLILRHELGHSIIKVGEEYDGGYAYFGVNAFTNLSEPVPWAHWLSPEEKAKAKAKAKARVRVERSVMPMQTYAWTMLNTSTPWSQTFISAGTYSRYVVRCSLSGLPDKSDLKVELDGVDLRWEPRKDIGVDRWHYDFYRDGGLSEGVHEVKFTLLNPELEGVAQMCSAEVIEFGDEKEFISSPGHYGIYPTYSDQNETSYRPTNEDCLMRIVTTPNFCKVCTEGLWYSLLRRVNLIEGLQEECTPSSKSRTLTLKLVPLAHLREVPIDVEESWTITWSKDGEILSGFNNKTIVELGDKREALGTYTVTAKFSSAEIKVDTEGLSTDTLAFEILDDCK